VHVQNVQAAIPSPTVSVIRIGPFPIHIYALCIVAGIFVALWVTDRRWRARGGRPSDVGDVAGWAVIFGILGGRIYHVITDPELYFKAGRHPVDAFKIWDGGLGIWGAITLGALGVYIGCRRHRMNFVAFADAAAPGIVLAQAIGRLGNWFNNELYGRPTTLPWKLQIHQMDVVNGKAGAVIGYFHPTFLYELLWDVLVCVLLIWADRHYRLARGRVFLLYVLGYTAGRFWVESLRSDTANHVLGMRVNSWVSILVFLAALAAFVRQRGKPRSSALDGRSPDRSPDGPDRTPVGPVPSHDAAADETDPTPDEIAPAAGEIDPDPAPAHREVE
jgi:prolipoprotein diacylglyceryl transferase